VINFRIRLVNTGKNCYKFMQLSVCVTFSDIFCHSRQRFFAHSMLRASTFFQSPHFTSFVFSIL
jgi:hypothetical protein